MNADNASLTSECACKYCVAKKAMAGVVERWYGMKSLRSQLAPTHRVHIPHTCDQTLSKTHEKDNRRYANYRARRLSFVG